MSHELISELNEGLLANKRNILVTLETSQEPIFWLNALAPLNILDISVTPEVSQKPIFELNVVLFSNKLLILVTREVHRLILLTAISVTIEVLSTTV